MFEGLRSPGSGVTYARITVPLSARASRAATGIAASARRKPSSGTRIRSATSTLLSSPGVHERSAAPMPMPGLADVMRRPYQPPLSTHAHLDTPYPPDLRGG